MYRNFKVPFAASLLVAALSACSDSSDRDNGAEVNPCPGEETTSERLFLQQLTDTSVIIKWRGDAEAACVGTDEGMLNLYADATTTEGDHKEAYFSGLEPGTMYYYSVGAADVAVEGQSFSTSPTAGEMPADGNTRIWLIGDSGTGGDDEREDHEGEAAEVLAGMETYIAQDGEGIDLFLMLGDNAYHIGSDFNYQQAVFETYPDLLKQASLWPVIGNHEMGRVQTTADPDAWILEKDSEPQTAPYFDIFTLPTGGEAGGVASGTEQYYSVDYGNVHVVVLDTQLSARDEDQRAAMRSWLVDDLSSNTADWTIVTFHHPPYSKGSNHDSDELHLYALDYPQKLMREEFVPVFDEYGVDLVYSGHSHSYERSYYLHNHTGTSDTFSPAEHAELVDGDPTNPATGRDGEGYQQLSPTSGGVDDRAVYTVAGSSGKADQDSGHFTDPAVWLRHAAHVEQPADTTSPKHRGLPRLGSVLVDASDTLLTASFIDVNGDALDQFTISR